MPSQRGWHDQIRPIGHDDCMSTVFMYAVVSVDGFIADANDDVGPLFDWYFNGDTEIAAGQPFKISQESICGIAFAANRG